MSVSSLSSASDIGGLGGATAGRGILGEATGVRVGLEVEEAEVVDRWVEETWAAAAQLPAEVTLRGETPGEEASGRTSGGDTDVSLRGRSSTSGFLAGPGSGWTTGRT